MKLALNKESAVAIRELSISILFTMENINMSTMQLLGIYNHVEDVIGVHKGDFSGMFEHLKKAEEYATESVQILSPMLQKVADKIDDYVAMNPQRK